MLATPTDVFAGEGCVIDARLRLEERVGEGGAGEVWRARHLERGEDVAVKLLSPRYRWSASSRDAFVASFLREAGLARRIDSPHVVRVMECGLSREVGPYLVMEMLNGLDLFEQIAVEGTLDVAETGLVVAQLCLALEAVHAAGVVHRDVKPENVVVGARGGRRCATLIDFSIAREMGAPDDGDGSVSGTPAYLSPERVEGTCAADAHADLWALGVLAYQCLAGTVPFDDRSIGAVSEAIERASFTPPSELLVEPSPALDAWFRRAFARERSRRFASAAEMREAVVEAWGPFPLGAMAPVDSSEAVVVGRASGVRTRAAEVASRGTSPALVSSPWRGDTPCAFPGGCGRGR